VTSTRTEQPVFEVTLSGALPQPLEREELIQLTRAVTVRGGAPVECPASRASGSRHRRRGLLLPPGRGGFSIQRTRPEPPSRPFLPPIFGEAR
jgi:hypothetical protein